MNTSDWLVLIVEDEPDGLTIVSALLEANNIATHGVRTAEEALSLLSQHHYNGVIIDLALPGMDGWQLLAAIRADERTAHLPCFAITAYHNSTVRRQASESGFMDYFPKPLDDRHFVDELIHAINAAAR